MTQIKSISFKKIKSIKEIKVDKTYDFAVRDEHRIIARQEGNKNGFYTSNCWHPDIEEFITAKQTKGRLTKFNMSVMVTDDFMDAVKNHKPWNLEFPDLDNKEEQFPSIASYGGPLPKTEGTLIKEIYKSNWDGNLKTWKEKGFPTKIWKTYKDANELWDLIMKSTYTRNEPGVLFIDRINHFNNLWYTEYINATNPCVVGDTLVLTNIGWIKIKNLKKYKPKGIKIITSDKDRKLFNSDLTWVDITHKDDDIFKVSFGNGEFLLTNKKHKLYNSEFNQKTIEELKENDLVFGYNEMLKIVDIEDLGYKEDVYDLTAVPNYNFFSIYGYDEKIIEDEIIVNDNVRFNVFDIVKTNKGGKFAFQLNEGDEII